MLKRFFVAFFKFIFLIVALPTMLVWGAGLALFDGDFYGEQLNEGIYDFAVAQLSVMAAENADFDLGNVALEGELTQGEVATVLQSVLTPDDFGEVFDSIKQQVVEPVGENVDILQFKINLKPFTDRGDLIAAQIAELIYAKQPAEVRGLIAEKDFVNRFQRQFDTSIVSDVPNEAVFEVEVPLEAGQSLGGFVRGIFDRVFYIGATLMALLLILIGVVTYSPITRVLKNMFFALLLAGGETLLIFYGLSRSGELIHKALAENANDLTGIEVDFFLNIYNYFMVGMWERVYDSLFVVMLVILIGFLVSTFYDYRGRKKGPPAIA